jgi:hypothetical protein
MDRLIGVVFLLALGAAAVWGLRVLRGMHREPPPGIL